MHSNTVANAGSLADKNFVAQTYEAKKRNFEQTFKAIDQSIRYNQELVRATCSILEDKRGRLGLFVFFSGWERRSLPSAAPKLPLPFPNISQNMFQLLFYGNLQWTLQNALTRVPPERKLSFLTLAFDKINPNWIQQVLSKYNWSVEVALDDILKAEEARLKQLEEQRRREEEERKKREDAERAIIEARRVENERHNVVVFCQSMFPALHPAFVAETVAKSGFNAGTKHLSRLRIVDVRC